MSTFTSPLSVFNTKKVYFPLHQQKHQTNCHFSLFVANGPNSKITKDTPLRHSIKIGLDSGLWTLDSGLWTLDSGLWTLDSGLWTLDSGLWTLDSGLWTLDSGLWTLDSTLYMFCIEKCEGMG